MFRMFYVWKVDAVVLYKRFCELGNTNVPELNFLIHFEKRYEFPLCDVSFLPKIVEENFSCCQSFGQISASLWILRAMAQSGWKTFERPRRITEGHLSLQFELFSSLFLPPKDNSYSSTQGTVCTMIAR